MLIVLDCPCLPGAIQPGQGSKFTTNYMELKEEKVEIGINNSSAKGKTLKKLKKPFLFKRGS